MIRSVNQTPLLYRFRKRLARSLTRRIGNFAAGVWEPAGLALVSTIDGRHSHRHKAVDLIGHDGFCMFDSQYTDYKITKTPYGKDIVAMLAEAARKENMPLGFYYSPPDMHHPCYRDTSKPASENWQGRTGEARVAALSRLHGVAANRVTDALRGC